MIWELIVINIHYISTFKYPVSSIFQQQTYTEKLWLFVFNNFYVIYKKLLGILCIYLIKFLIIKLRVHFKEFCITFSTIKYL